MHGRVGGLLVTGEGTGRIICSDGCRPQCHYHSRRRTGPRGRVARNLKRRGAQAPHPRRRPRPWQPPATPRWRPGWWWWWWQGHSSTRCRGGVGGSQGRPEPANARRPNAADPEQDQTGPGGTGAAAEISARDPGRGTGTGGRTGSRDTSSSPAAAFRAVRGTWPRRKTAGRARARAQSDPQGRQFCPKGLIVSLFP